MLDPTTGTTTDPERDVNATPRRLSFVGAAASLVVIISLLLLVIWLVPTDDAPGAAEPGPGDSTADVRTRAGSTGMRTAVGGYARAIPERRG